MTKEDILKEFFALNSKNTFIQLAVRKYCRMGYTGLNQLNELDIDVRLRAEQDEIEKNYADFIHKDGVVEVLGSYDLEEESGKPQYKFSTEMQYKYSKEIFGLKVCVDDLMED